MLTALCSYACAIAAILAHVALASRGITLPIVDDRSNLPLHGRICAYGDINKDRYTDLVVQRGAKLIILLQSEGGNFRDSGRYAPILLEKSAIVSCTVGDFNGDASPDILVVTNTDSSYKAVIYYPHETNAPPFPLQLTYVDQPVVMDVNGDGISDVLGFVKNDSRFALSCTTGKRGNVYEDCSDRFVGGDFSAGPYPLFPHFFMDLDGDLASEIVFGLKDAKVGLRLSVWKLENDRFFWRSSDLLPPLPDNPEYRVFGAPLVGDFNADAKGDVLIPVCNEDSAGRKCADVSKFLVWSITLRRWEAFQLDLRDVTLVTEPNSLVVFRVGEFSLDGYPDLIATVTINGIPSPIILENVPSDNGNFSRRFEINLQKDFRIILPGDMSKSEITLSAFFDMKEDGNLDILVEYVNKADRTPFIDFIKCDDKGDTTFLKVQVFSNVCVDDCPLQSPSDRGSGIAWTGACASYSMSTSYGAPRVSMQCQLPQTSYRTFHSPFVLFGLGRSPNFVDEVDVGSPRFPAGSLNQHHVLKQIVPNSRVIIVPPERDGTHWQSRLYLTPSRLIIQSLLVQISVCVILFILVIVLHLREKRDDRRERQSQSYRFHFDAM